MAEAFEKQRKGDVREFVIPDEIKAQEWADWTGWYLYPNDAQTQLPSWRFLDTSGEFVERFSEPGVFYAKPDWGDVRLQGPFTLEQAETRWDIP